MGFSFIRFVTGINITPKDDTSTSTSAGDLQVLSANNKLFYHNGSTNSPVVTENQTATLTNKTISGSANTITNVTASGLSPSYELPRSQIAVDGPAADYVLINNDIGDVSSEQYLAKARGGAGSNMSNVAFPTTGVIVTRDEGMVLTNKNISTQTNTIPSFVFAGDNEFAPADSVLTADGAGNSSWEAPPGAGVVDTTHGGTNFSSYSVGDVLYASGTTGVDALAKLHIGTANQTIKVNASATAPIYATKQIVIGTPVTTIGLRTNTAFGATTNPISVSIVPVRTGTFKIGGSFLIEGGALNTDVYVRVAATAGSPTVLFSQEGVAETGITGQVPFGSVTPYLLATLTAGGNYTFQLEGKSIASGQIAIRNDKPSNGQALVIEEIGF